jgi:hypothetical protein
MRHSVADGQPGKRPEMPHYRCQFHMTMWPDSPGGQTAPAHVLDRVFDNGQVDLVGSPPVQENDRCICLGIRNAFKIRNYSRTKWCH